MNDFWRVVRLACRRRLVLAACLTTSLLVALTWGFNLGVIYPVVEIVFAGRGASGYLADKEAKTEEAILTADVQIADLEKRLAEASDPRSRRAIQLQIEYHESKQRAYGESLQWTRYIRPYADQYMPETPFKTLVLIIVLLLIGTVFKLCMLTCNLMLVQELTERTAFDIRMELFRKSLRLDLEHFGDSGSSGLMSRLTNDIGILSAGLSVLFGRMIREPLKMVVCLACAAWISWRLLLVVLIISPLLALVISSLSRSIRRASRRVLDEMTQLYGLLGEAFAGIRLVKAYHTFGYERMRFRASAQQYYRKSMKMALYNALARPISELLGMSMLSLAVLAGGYLLLNRETHLLGIPMSSKPLEFGEMMAFFTFLIGVTDPARKLSDVWSQLQRGMAAADRVYELSRLERRVSDPETPSRPSRPHRQIALRDIYYRYPTGAEVLQGIDLTIKHGETIAIVGPNGSGKSTLISMLCRFDDPQSGEILVDDVPLTQITLRDLRSRIGLVTQQSVTFEDTILNNIRYGSPRADRDMVIAAAQAAHADEFIRAMPDGYDTCLGTGQIRLSGGQLQRIALARAILRNPDILILDEATSQIDMESEALIHNALDEFLKGRTGIMITHRPSTLQLAHRIAVIEEGRVSGLGTHEQLLSRNSFYRNLVGPQPTRKSA